MPQTTPYHEANYLSRPVRIYQMPKRFTWNKPFFDGPQG